MAIAEIINRLSLQKKFVIITSVAIVVLMSLIGFIVIRRERTILYNEIEKKGRIFAETLAIPLINDLIYEKLGLVEEGGLIDNYITELYRKRYMDFLYLMVLDEKGRVISHNDFKEYGKIYADSITRNALSAKDSIVQEFYDNTGHRALDFATPLSIGKKRWGTLKFGVSLKGMENEMASMVRRILFLTLFFLSGGFVIIYVLSKRFIGPITELARTMEQAGGENLDVKVEIKGHDELALLGESFNRMIERIKEANLQLKRTHEKLLQSEKLASIGILASGVAHEINNPLGGLFNCVQMLEEMGENEEFRKKYLSLLKEGLSRIENTVGKLLWMARSSNREPEILELKTVLKDVYNFVEYRVKKRNIQYHEDIEDGMSIIVDPHDLQQILINLIINAIQAMPEGGEMTIRGYSEDGLKVIEVSDTGMGIKEEDMGRIFDPFFTTKQPGEGTGLGLWLTYEIIKNYNGDIQVESKEGEGTTFKIIFKEKE